MTNAESKSGPRRALRTLLPATIVVVAMPAFVVAEKTGSKDVTFASDVAPIFQDKCQMCHRPGSIAPMSLLTYEDVRPWARAIKERVSLREMPPWHLDKSVGIRKYKNDRSLTDDQIATIVAWVDAGAPIGDPKHLPPPRQWPNDDLWTIGAPDLMVTSPNEHVMHAYGPDSWVDYEAHTGLTEDRYIKAVETKPSKAGRRIVHHAVTSIIRPEGNEYLSEYAVGKYGDIFPENTGRLLKAGTRLNFNMHYHAVGEEIRDRTIVAFVFYPQGVVPTYQVEEANVGLLVLDDDLDIPANRVTGHHAYFRLPKPARLISFQPHMHMRGKAMTLEAIYPNGRTEVLGSVDHFDFNWQVAYIYDEDVAPLLPTGTILHTIGVYDNTAKNPRNPDPDQWVGFGNRSIDEMLQCHTLLVYLDDNDFLQMITERKAKAGN